MLEQLTIKKKRYVNHYFIYNEINYLFFYICAFYDEN